MSAPAQQRKTGSVRRPNSLPFFASLFLLLLVAALGSLTVGAAGIPLPRLLAAFGIGATDPALAARDEVVLWAIRIPRIVLAGLVGAMLAGAGTAMQGLFRNPLADPALVGVSSGAALAAAVTIVVGDRFLTADVMSVPVEILPFAAFGGGLLTTILLYRIATSYNRTSIAVFLLGGIAIAALAGAGLGLLIFLANDQQLRDINFWMLGSLSGATWGKVAAIFPFFVAAIVVSIIVARGLDLLALGESEAYHSGFSVERLKRMTIIVIAAATGAAVSVSGVIGFVGIVVPHLLRLVIGPGHRRLLPASFLLGAALMMTADSTARVIVAPAELPIGIITALIGAPFFLYLLLRQRSLVSL